MQLLYKRNVSKEPATSILFPQCISYEVLKGNFSLLK